MTSDYISIGYVIASKMCLRDVPRCLMHISVGGTWLNTPGPPCLRTYQNLVQANSSLESPREREAAAPVALSEPR